MYQQHTFLIGHDKCVIIKFFTARLITADFQNKYDTTAGDCLKAEAELQAAQDALSDAEHTGMVELSKARHRQAVENYERIRKQLEDMDCSLVGEKILDDTIQISAACMNGKPSWVKLNSMPYLQLKQICDEVGRLREAVQLNRVPFRDTQDF